MVERDWGGEVEQVLQAIPAIVRLAGAEEQDLTTAELVFRMIELVGKGAGSVEVSRIDIDSAGEPSFEFQASIELGDQLPGMVELIEKLRALAGDNATLEETELAGVSFTRIGEEKAVMWGGIGE